MVARRPGTPATLVGSPTGDRASNAGRVAAPINHVFRNHRKYVLVVNHFFCMNHIFARGGDSVDESLRGELCVGARLSPVGAAYGTPAPFLVGS